MTTLRPELLDELLTDYEKPDYLLGEEGLFKQLKKALLERALGAELSDHLGYEKGDPAGRGTGNSRNGHSDKRVLTEDGEVNMAVPRDRNGTFEPVIVPKGERRLDGFDDRILSLYARGMTVREIRGCGHEGDKEVLGLWIEQTEGAKFWLKVMNELRTRGLQDILIAVVDGLTGFPDAIGTVFPRTAVQTCIVHLIRNSLAFVSWKDRKKVMPDLKAVYRAETAEAAAARLDEFEAR